MAYLVRSFKRKINPTITLSGLRLWGWKNQQQAFCKENIKELIASITTRGGFELIIHMQASNRLPQIFRWLRDKSVFQQALEAKVYSAYNMLTDMLALIWQNTDTKTCHTRGFGKSRIMGNLNYPFSFPQSVIHLSGKVMHCLMFQWEK